MYLLSKRVVVAVVAAVVDVAVVVPYRDQTCKHATLQLFLRQSLNEPANAVADAAVSFAVGTAIAVAFAAAVVKLSNFQIA